STRSSTSTVSGPRRSSAARTASGSRRIRWMSRTRPPRGFRRALGLLVLLRLGAGLGLGALGPGRPARPARTGRATPAALAGGAAGDHRAAGRARAGRRRGRRGAGERRRDRADRLRGADRRAWLLGGLETRVLGHELGHVGRVVAYDHVLGHDR